MAPFQFVDSGAPIGVTRDIKANMKGRATERFVKAARGGAVDIGDRDVCAFGREALNDGAPDAGRAASHQRRPSSESLHRRGVNRTRSPRYP